MVMEPGPHILHGRDEIGYDEACHVFEPGHEALNERLEAGVRAVKVHENGDESGNGCPDEEHRPRSCYDANCETPDGGYQDSGYHRAHACQDGHKGVKRLLDMLDMPAQWRNDAASPVEGVRHRLQGHMNTQDCALRFVKGIPQWRELLPHLRQNEGRSPGCS